MNSSSKSILIVGQGIAGSILAWHLLKRGHQLLIVDQDHHESSSMISAGMITPITGQRLSPTPDFDMYFACAMQSYDEISQTLGIQAFVPKPIIRVLRSQDEVARTKRLQASSATQAHIAGIHPPGHFGAHLKDPLGSVTFAKGGYTQTALLLKSMRSYFQDQQILVSEKLSYDDLIIKDNTVQWKSQRFDAVIFCEGYKANQNPWFKEIPYNFAKGDILRIAFEGALLPDAIMCQQQWCLPLADGTYLAGSTYNRTKLDTLSTSEGQLAVLTGLSDFIDAQAKILEARAAVRPIILNTRPIIAQHQTIPALRIFNGFGSKGFLWAAHHAQTYIV